MIRVAFSEQVPRLDWSEARSLSLAFGPKGASCLALPRPWVPEFSLIPAEAVAPVPDGAPLSNILDPADLERMLAPAGRLIVRSSVIGESIWERGTYESVLLDPQKTPVSALDAAAAQVVASARGRPIALIVQKHVDAASQGEFGNLQRISKTRDQWELSRVDRSGVPSRMRLNSQRDIAADPDTPIFVRAGVSTERLFGSVAAWLNNELLRGKAQRFNCEWVTDNRCFYLVQLDEEDEDVGGVNPFQLRVLKSESPPAGSGRFLRAAEGAALASWDKLKVLEELWEEHSAHRPVLFYVGLDDLPPVHDLAGKERLREDFATLIGKTGIVVRTSVEAGAEKIANLPRTECLDPDRAALWCLERAAELRAAHSTPLAFIAHRFVASRASAWARADPASPMVEIHSLWGLPDALQYCPYDIWEVHLPTGVATDNTEYKSDMLLSRDDGGWQHARVKNEVARANSISTAEARDLARRSAAIAGRLGRACHIMWFVGCVDSTGTEYNLPWYWTETHDAERNIDRSAYNVVTVSDRESLWRFQSFEGQKQRLAVALKPIDLELMRDNAFIAEVGRAAREFGVPVILTGSTLAHAYYQLRKQDCVVVTPVEKERSRIRRTASLGKLVRDKVPARIAARREHEVTKQIPTGLVKGFLLGKLLEEAIEVREAKTQEQKQEELADLYEVLRALAKAEGHDFSHVSEAADRKREKAGGFEQGLVLLQTGISPGERTNTAENFGQLLAAQTAIDTIEMPFSFFGFMELDQPRSLLLDQFGIRLDVSLRADRIEIRVSRSSEQLDLALDEPAPMAS